MSNLTIDDIKRIIKGGGVNPDNYSDEELRIIANKFIKLSPEEVDNWDKTHKEY